MSNLTITPQAAITLVKVPFNASCKDTLYFATKAAQNTYFEGLIGQQFTNYTYVKKDSVIKVEMNYEDAKNYNYLFYDNITQEGTGLVSKRIFCFIVAEEYVNENTTKLYIKTDTIQTYLSEILADKTSVSYINKQHVKKTDDVIGRFLLDEGLQGSEYVKSQLLDETSYATDTSSINWGLITDTEDQVKYLDSSTGNYMIVAGCTENILGTLDALKNRMYGGIYSGLTYYGFASVEQVSLFIGYLNQSAAIDVLFNLFLIPISIANWRPWPATVDYNTVDESGNPTTKTVTIRMFKVESTTYKTLDTLTCSTPTRFKYAGTTLVTDGYTPHNNKLYTAPYCQIQLSNNNGGVANYNYEYFDSKNACQFKINGTISQGGSIIAYPLNYKGRSSNWDEPLDMTKFPTCSWNTDSYTNWLTQTAVSRSNNARYAEEDYTAGIVKGSIKTAFAAGSVISGDIGAIKDVASGAESLYDTVKQNERAIDSLEEEKYRAKLVPDAINNGTACPDVMFSMGTFEFTAWALTITGERARQIDAYFDRFGYTVNNYANLVQAITSRSKWNYVKTADCKIKGNIPNEDLLEIESIFNEGITFWKNANEIYRYDLGGQND